MYPTYFTDAFQPLLPGIRHIEFNSFETLENIDQSIAAVIVETVQGEAGLVPPNPEWLLALRRRCDETGSLLILDEIQAGMGRTGHLFAFEQYGIVPDILLLAKGFGGGMPLGAFIAKNDLMKLLTHDPVLGHITTFGGHPVCVSAGLATLEILLEGELLAQVPEKEALFKQLLVHSSIKEVRSAGLWLAVDLGSAAMVQGVIQYCIREGVITDWFLFKEKAVLHYVGMEDAVINLNRSNSPEWNHQFIVDYFSGPSAKKDTAAKKDGLQFDLKKVHLQNVRFNQLDGWYVG